MCRFPLLLLVLLLCGPRLLQAQYGVARAALARVPTVTLPRQDNAALLRRERSSRRPDRPEEFAVSLPVDRHPDRDGRWTDRNGRAVWQLLVESPGAKSLNLGFTDFRLPPGAELYLATDAVRYGPFSSADGADHAQFWSPLLPGDRLLVELVMPDASTEGVHLTLSTVNHDYAGALELLSDDCNIDVICGAADGLPMIDDYRDVIRSVAAYTLEGKAKCTGFLVNNTNQDGRPLFLTADHCNVDADNAPTVVAYWNFENSSCREPGSAASGEEGDGKLEVFNSGARLLAKYAPTDMVLLELDDPVNPRANAFFAGWDAAGGLPQEGVVGIHHPQLDEKRISFSYQPTLASDAFGGDVTTPDFNYLRVPSWDLGTTQGGSSGSPLFDLDGRVRGQLLGGTAGCDNDGFDIYGYLNRSWTGGGSPSTRLRDWLDPSGGNRRLLDGREQATLAAQLTAQTRFLTTCATDTASFVLTPGADFPAGSQVDLITPKSISLTAPATAAAGEAFRVTYTGAAVVATGEYTIGVVIMGGGISDTLPLELTLLAGPPTAPPPRLANQAVLDPYVTLDWGRLGFVDDYDLQVAPTRDFTARTADLRRLTDTTYTFEDPLAGGSTFFWRVRASNACGSGEWSAPRSFTTTDRQCISRDAPSLPLPISPVDSNRVIAELRVTDPLTVASIEVQLGITHSFTGDLYADLISPDGQTFRLFRPLQGGFCTGLNINAVFSDGAGTTAEDFAASCPTTDAGEYPSVQPLDPFAALIGTAAQGLWQLVVTDPIDRDGGEITDFQLRICAAGADGRDLGVGITTDNITACANLGGSARLQLGADYTEEVDLRVEAEDLPLDNYNYTYDPATGLLDVTFTAWTLVGAGTFPLSYVTIATDGSERRATHTLTVLPVPTLAEDLLADADDSEVTFYWRTTADESTLELSGTENFAALIYSSTTPLTSLTVARDALPESFYWRVRTATTCGELTGPARFAAIDSLIPVREVGLGYDLAIYPNPTTGALTLTRTGDRAGEPLQLSLFSPTGQRLQEWYDQRGGNLRIDLGNRPPGVYQLRITGSTGATTRRILLVR